MDQDQSPKPENQQAITKSKSWLHVSDISKSVDDNKYHNWWFPVGHITRENFWQSWMLDGLWMAKDSNRGDVGTCPV